MSRRRRNGGSQDRPGTTRHIARLLGGALKHAGERLLAAAGEETSVERARRLGFVTHGEFGIRIAYDPDIVSDRVVDAIENGGYERFEGRRSKSFIDDGARIIELGAGLGFLSALIMLSKRIDDYQLVEADLRLPDMMRRTHELNGARGPVTIHTCVATCDSDMITAGKASFFVDRKLSDSSLLGAPDPLQTIEVPVVSLHEMIREHRSTVLIADIEGGEVGLFNGTSLGTIEKILIEIHPDRIGQAGVRDIFRNLDRLGYVFEPAASAGDVCGFRRIEEP